MALFFRWTKCILGCPHWLAERKQSVATQIYLALIAALLLQLHTGRRVEELEARLKRELDRLASAARNKTGKQARDTLWPSQSPRRSPPKSNHPKKLIGTSP